MRNPHPSAANVRININIDRLVLDGVAEGQVQSAAELGKAVEVELQSLIADAGLPGGIARWGRRPSHSSFSGAEETPEDDNGARPGDHLAQTEGPGLLGARIARSIYDSMMMTTGGGSGR